jgi:ectoine hydroxylase-related dioxygenase (phytanoyl-CoA dioxygenase family)
MTVQEALYGLGVRDDTLSEEEKSRLDRDGFLLLTGMLTPERCARIAARLDELVAEEGPDAGKEVHQEAGTDRLADLVNKDPIFEVCFTHPRLLAAVAHVLKGDLRLYSLNSRSALPGKGEQAFHVDFSGPVEPGDYSVCNSAWLLDGFTGQNGPTRVVPGSHRSGKVPRDGMEDPRSPHPEEIRVLAPAGTVLVFNSHLWHSGTRNDSASPRRVIHAAFARRALPQQTEQRAYLRPETSARLSEAARVILDV